MRDRIELLLSCLAVVVICWILYNWFQDITDTTLQVVLYPHKKATEIFYHISLPYEPGIGYLAQDSSFAIGRECMGLYFTLMLFGMNTTMFMKYTKGYYKVLWLLLCFTSAIMISVVVSSIRIIGSIPFIAHAKFPLIHSGVGITLYFLTLVFSYSTLMKLFERGKENEKAF